MRFEPKGPIFELWLEDMMVIKPDIEDKLESLPSFLKFFWGMKVFIQFFYSFEICLINLCCIILVLVNREHAELCPAQKGAL